MGASNGRGNVSTVAWSAEPGCAGLNCSGAPSLRGCVLGESAAEKVVDRHDPGHRPRLVGVQVHRDNLRLAPPTPTESFMHVLPECHEHAWILASMEA